MICKRCKKEKGTEFYGNDTSCKECRCAFNKAYRDRNIDAIRNYDRMRCMRPDRVEARKRLMKTPSGIQSRLKTIENWNKKNKEKRAAHSRFWRELANGKIFKQPCEVCGESKAQAHHEDYSKPLEVRWLCTKHHKPADRERRAREKQLNK